MADPAYSQKPYLAFESGKLQEVPADKPLSTSGGGGTFDGMERLAKLEVLMDVAGKRLDRMEDKIEKIGERLARLEENVRHLPTKGFIVTATSLTLALLVAAITLQGKLQSLFGLVAP